VAPTQKRSGPSSARSSSDHLVRYGPPTPAEPLVPGVAAAPWRLVQFALDDPLPMLLRDEPINATARW
jgi:hypothetical protein